MTYLLDAHILLWWLADHKNLRKDYRGMIASPENRILLSVAVLWELQIKTMLGKLKLPVKFFREYRSLGFEELPITARHVNELAELPQHHRDPFDRMLIAQARTEKACVLTEDKAFHSYAVSTL